MSNIINREKVFSLAYYLPLLWVSTGMIWDGDGDMRMVPIVLLAVFVSLYQHRGRVFLDNLNDSFWVKLLLVNAIFGAVSYWYHGFDSRELRATIVVFFYLSFVPRRIYTYQLLQYFLLVSSVSALLFACYFNPYLNMARGVWPVNAIPFGSICGMISILSVFLLYKKYDDKLILLPLISFLFSFSALILSESRGPILSLVMIVLVLLLFFNQLARGYKMASLMGFALILALAFNSSYVQKRIQATIGEVHNIERGNLETSIGYRLQMHKIAYQLFKESPILGHGHGGQLNERIEKWHDEGIISAELARLMTMTFHNGLTEKLVMYGTIGGVIFLFFMCYPIYFATRYRLDAETFGFWGSACFIILCNVTEATFINPQAMIFYTLPVGLLIFISHQERAQDKSIKNRAMAVEGFDCQS